MSQLIVDGNEIIPGSIEVTTTNTSITPKDNLQVVLNINQVSSTAVVGSGTDLGMRMSLINKNSNACTVIFGGEGGTVSYTLALNKTLKLVWVGTYWIGTVGGVLSGVDNAGNSFSYNTETVLHAIPQNTQYTTEEVDTGMKWIDGKKVYQKVFTTTSITEDIQTYRTQYYSPYFSVPNIETIIKVEGTFAYTYNGTSGYVEIFGSSSIANDSALSAQWTTFIETQIPNQRISFGISKHKNFAMVPTKMTIIAYYTKTTD